MRSMSVDIPMTSGGAGAATGSKTISPGLPTALRSVFVSYATAPVTTVITVADRMRTVLTTPASATAKVFNPTEVTHDAAGAPVALAGGPSCTPPTIHGRCTITVTLADPASVVTATLFFDDDA